MSYSCADKVLLLADWLHLKFKIIIFHFWWFTRGEIPPLLVLLRSSERAIPAAPVRRWCGRSGRAQVTSGASLGGCPPGEMWGSPAAPAGQPLAAARAFLALHWLLLFHIAVLWGTEPNIPPTVLHVMQATSKPTVKVAFLFSSSPGDAVARPRCKGLWSPLQQHGAFSRQLHHVPIRKYG